MSEISVDDEQVRAIAEVMLAAVDGEGRVRLGQAEMAARSGIAPRTLRRAIGRMESAGWVTIEDVGSPNSPAVYDVNVLAGVAAEAGWEPRQEETAPATSAPGVMRVLSEEEARAPLGAVHPGERLLVPPAWLSAGENVRSDLRVDDVFVETIRELGVLKDIDVYPTLTGLVILDGHRRFRAACEAGLEWVPVRVVEVTSEAERIATQLVENDAHLHTAAIERAKAVQQLVLFGLTVKDLRKHGVTRDEVSAAKRVAVAPPAVKDLADSAPRMDLVTLGKVAELAETAESEEAYEQLVARIVEEPDQVDFIVEEERGQAEIRARLQEAAEEFEAQGIRVVEQIGDRGAYLTDLTNEDGTSISDDEHVSCPGHAVILHYYRYDDEVGDRAVCLDWVAGGHRNRYARNTSGATSGPMSEEAKKERAELIRKNREAESAQVVRTGFVKHTLLARRKLPKDWALFAAPVIDRISALSPVPVSSAVQMLAIDEMLYRAPDVEHRAEKGIFSYALAVGESTLMDKNFWRFDRYWDSVNWTSRIQRLYLRSLEAWGYTLSNLEREFCEYVEQNDKEPDSEHAAEVGAFRHAIPAKEDAK